MVKKEPSLAILVDLVIHQMATFPDDESVLKYK